MSLSMRIENLQKQLQQSPILKLGKSLPNFEGEFHSLKEFRNDAETLREKCDSPLKMVIMGEVKSGKSTLLNALAGEAVSPTNVTEATACIIEINYASERKGEIVKGEGKISGTTEEIYEILNNHKGDLGFFKDVEAVKLQFPIANLRKLHLIDTPGLGTITDVNQETTMNYIQNSDVVLWVFSAHHLGQADIEDYIEKVKSYGKPIIAVINRLDESSGSKEELEEYIQDRMGFYIDETFAISAFQAFEALKSDDVNLMDKSNLPRLLNYLETNIESQDSVVQEQSILSSIHALAEKDQIQHQLIDNSLKFLLESLERRREDIRYQNERIKRKLTIELNNWASNNLLEGNKQLLMQEISLLNSLSSKKSYQQISLNLAEAISKENVLKSLELKYEEIRSQFKNEWHEAVQNIGEKMKLEESEFLEKHEEMFNKLNINTLTYLPKVENAVADGAFKGAAIGGAYGVAAATYSAVLGPYAAAITMGTAFAAIIPGVLIVGAVTGITAKLVLGNKKKNEYNTEITRAFQEVRNEVASTVIPYLNEQIELESNQIGEKLFEQLCEFLSNGWTENELIELRQQLNNYIYLISNWESQRNELKNSYSVSGL